MAALSPTFFRDDPEQEARDIAACERDIERLRYRPITAEQQRMLAVHVKWLDRMTKAAA